MSQHLRPCDAYMYVIIDSDNDLPPAQHQAIAWTIVDLLSVVHLGTNLSDVLTFELKQPSKKCMWKCHL